MQAIFHKRFQKNYAKLSDGVKDKFENQLEVFYGDCFDKKLSNHELHGKYKNHRSINVSGDLRAIYTMLNKDTALFIDIGSHSELYS